MASACVAEARMLRATRMMAMTRTATSRTTTAAMPRPRYQRLRNSLSVIAPFLQSRVGMTVSPSFPGSNRAVAAGAHRRNLVAVAVAFLRLGAAGFLRAGVLQLLVEVVDAFFERVGGRNVAPAAGH